MFTFCFLNQLAKSFHKLAVIVQNTWWLH